VGGALATWLLSIFGYMADAPVQTHGATQGIRLLVSVIPALIFMAGSALLFWYPINKKMELKIESELNERKKKL
jgi:Na+/melibiose symporter-like transporter